MRTMMTFASAAVLAAFAAAAAQADDYDTETAAGKPSLTLGIGAMYTPEYSGSDHYDTTIIPYLDGRKEVTPGNTLYITDMVGRASLHGGLDHAFDDKLSVGIEANYRLGRDESDSSSLTGMGDIDGAFEMGPKVRYQVNPLWGVEADALFDMSGANDGYTARVSSDFVMPLSRVTFLMFDGGINYGSEDFNNTYYGVKASQVRAGRPAYSPDGGFSNLDASVGIKHMITKHVSVNGKLGADYLIGDVADSPLVKDELQPKITAGLTYTF